MQPTEILKQEHRVIESVLTCLQKQAELADEDGRLDEAAARDTIDFLRNYADRWHHGKEEDRLFPLMEARGFSPEQGPTAVMRMEHVQGREHIRAMDAAIEGAARGNAEELARFVQNARSYVVLLRQHIEKEDHCLFPMADNALGAEEVAELARQFEQAEQEAGGADATTRLLRIARSLSERFGVAAVGS